MRYKYCPVCGNKMVEKIIDEHPRLRCSSCAFIFYQNSKPTACALIINQDKVLLGRRRVEPFKGMWQVVGGFLEAGEHPEEGLLREVREEAGLEVEIVDILGIFMDTYAYGTDDDFTLNIAYVVRVTGGTEKPGDDIEELRWFKITELPDNIAFKNGREILDRLASRHNHS